MASVLTERYPSTLPHHLHSPNTTITQLPLVTATPPTPAPPTPSAGSQQSQPSTTPGTTGTPLRSEKLLRDMLTKDVVARSRSLSRSSSSTAANHLQLQQQPASASASAPPLPLPTTTTTNAVSSPSNKHGSVSGHSRSSSGTDDRPIFASTGIGGAPALVFRPHPTNASARRTIDGNGVPSPSLSPPLATRHHTSPLPLPLGVQVQSPPPPLLVHANSSPLIGARSRLPGATMGSGMGGGAGVDVEGDWYDEECASPSPTSIHSSSSSRDSLHPLPNEHHLGHHLGHHQPLTPPHPHPHHHHQPHARSHHKSPLHMLSDTPPLSGASSTFDLESASEYCRQHVGYVSFGDIEGLGRPAAEEEEERVERLRLMREGEEGKRKKWLWSWLGATSAATAAGVPGSSQQGHGHGHQETGEVRRPKTPGLA